jgi:propionate CoA-transferase
VNISQTARRLVFCGTFTSGGLEVESTGDGIAIRREGECRKFVNDVEQLCFNSRDAQRRGQHVLYVTERAVFAATPDGLELLEVAPGIDLERDVLGQMEFRPVVRHAKPMPAHVFR